VVEALREFIAATDENSALAGKFESKAGLDVSWSARNEYFDDPGNPVHVQLPFDVPPLVVPIVPRHPMAGEGVDYVHIGKQLIEAIKADGRERVVVSSGQSFAIRMACTNTEWLVYQKAALELGRGTCAIAKIGNSALFVESHSPSSGPPSFPDLACVPVDKDMPTRGNA
jgi:hypothetical protein